MTELQFTLLILAIVGAGFSLGLGVTKVFDKLATINEKLAILPEISDRLRAIHEAIKSAQREPRR